MEKSEALTEIWILAIQLTDHVTLGKYFKPVFSFTVDYIHTLWIMALILNNIEITYRTWHTVGIHILPDSSHSIHI